jgi:hypothetical protein
VVFQQWEKKGEKLWNGDVSAVGKRHKVAEQWCFNDGESQKVIEQWCFINEENGERLLTVVFQQ